MSLRHPLRIGDQSKAPFFLQQLITSAKVKEKVRETLELLGIDFSDFDKYKAYQKSKHGGKISSTSV